LFVSGEKRHIRKGLAYKERPTGVAEGGGYDSRTPWSRGDRKKNSSRKEFYQRQEINLAWLGVGEDLREQKSQLWTGREGERRRVTPRTGPKVVEEREPNDVLVEP